MTLPGETGERELALWAEKTRKGATMLAGKAAESAIEKQLAWAAAMSSSGVVPGPVVPGSPGVPVSPGSVAGVPSPPSRNDSASARRR